MKKTKTPRNMRRTLYLECDPKPCCGMPSGKMIAVGLHGRLNPTMLSIYTGRQTFFLQKPALLQRDARNLLSVEIKPLAAWTCVTLRFQGDKKRRDAEEIALRIKTPLLAGKLKEDLLRLAVAQGKRGGAGEGPEETRTPPLPTNR